MVSFYHVIHWSKKALHGLIFRYVSPFSGCDKTARIQVTLIWKLFRKSYSRFLILTLNMALDGKKDFIPR